ncbi:Hypothetical predicted protein [Cloeon dipterum]|nr:Hypothetical predicted protein [Cloeon dipterum]
MMLYFVPAFMYCLYNNLAFVNLATYDPTTYYLLLQFRVVITGVVFQVLFKKQLSCKQWISLLLLTLGCMIKHIDIGNAGHEATKGTDKVAESSFSREISTLFILVQTVCSCFAGVYNEFLLKGEGAQVNIYVQNVFMYIDSIICNAGVLMVQGNLQEAFQPDALAAVLRPTVLLIMLNNAAIGIITSFFLKNLNSIVKTFASALELMFTAVFCWLLFGIPIHLSTVLAIAVVSYSVMIYSQNPVVNQTPTSTSAQSLKEPLIKEPLIKEPLIKDLEEV